MVVDVDDGGVRRDALDAAPGALQVARVEKEHQLRVDAVRRLGQDVTETRQELVHLRQRRRYEHPNFLARDAEGFSECQAASKRVSVGVLVAEDQDLLVGLDQLLDLVIDVRSLLRGGYFSASPFESPLV